MMTMMIMIIIIMIIIIIIKIIIIIITITTTIITIRVIRMKQKGVNNVNNTTASRSSRLLEAVTVNIANNRNQSDLIHLLMFCPTVARFTNCRHKNGDHVCHQSLSSKKKKRKKRRKKKVQLTKLAGVLCTKKSEISLYTELRTYSHMCNARVALDPVHESFDGAR